jgi:hypothetical protein
MSLDVQVAHSVEEVSQSEWDCLGEDQPFAIYRWYRFCDAALESDVSVNATPHRADEPVGMLLSGSRPVAEKDINIAQYPAVTDLDRAMELHRKVNRCYKAQTVSWMPPTMAHADLA